MSLLSYPLYSFATVLNDATVVWRETVSWRRLQNARYFGIFDKRRFAGPNVANELAAGEYL